MTMSDEKRLRIIGKVNALGVFSGEKMLTGNYVKEAVDPLHRPITVQNQLNSKYKKDFELDTNFDGDFYQWLEHMKKTLPGSDDRVTYLDNSQRPNYLVTFSGVKIIPNPDAEESYKVFISTYTGEFIFVLASVPLPSLYVGLKSVGTFHHSSLFAGRAVLAAGTMVLKDGSVLQVNNHSGHYKPGLGEMVKVVEHMRKNRALVDEIVFRVSGSTEWEGSGSALIERASLASSSPPATH